MLIITFPDMQTQNIKTPALPFNPLFPEFNLEL